MRIALSKEKKPINQFGNSNPDPVITYDHISESEARISQSWNSSKNNTNNVTFILEESLLAALAVICYMTCI